MKRRIIDTNVLVRFLTQDDEGLADKAEKIFRQAGKYELEIPDYIICEMVWVLLAVYELPKTEVIEKLQGLVNFEAFAVNRKVVSKAIEIYERFSISFVDALLLAQGDMEGKQVVSFDERIAKAAV